MLSFLSLLQDVINRFANGLTLNLKEDRLRNTASSINTNERHTRASSGYARWIDDDDNAPKRRNSYVTLTKGKHETK